MRGRIMFVPRLQFFEEMLVRHAVGNKLHPFSCHGTQELFSAFVDERYVIQVDKARPPLAGLVRRIPTFLQLPHPGRHEATLQSPSHFRCGFRYGDLQHVLVSCPSTK
jgi:hypothetical protein